MAVLKVSPILIGSGRAGEAAAKSLACVGITDRKWDIAPPFWVPRGTSLASLTGKFENPLVVVSNPHGLHARTLIEAEAAGFGAIACEKPSCVNRSELQALRALRKAKVAVLHVYRQMWGPQTLKALVSGGELGELICIEGRYWQPSTAERALRPPPSSVPSPAAANWKNDVALSGPSDVLLDIACHWADAAIYLYGERPDAVSGWKSYKNAEAPHRDSHVHLTMGFPSGGRALGSISKTVHGSTNHFELCLIGTRRSATWNFLSPDEIVLGEGRDRTMVTRKTADIGSWQAPHHGAGWIEGYIEIFRQLMGEAFLGEKGSFPRLSENLDLMESLFQV